MHRKESLPRISSGRRARRGIAWALGALAFAGSGALMAKDCTTRSGPYKNALVELYTSEGCSSCPPADRWLSSIRPGATQPEVVPIAFHVSYWDYIGWKDPYADGRFTQRQRALAVAAGRGGVYTPQVVLDGADFDRWRRASADPAFTEVERVPAKADLELATVNESGAIAATVKVDLRGTAKAHGLDLVVALTESHLSSRVTAGENRGETLRHEFVARDIASFPVAPGREYRARFAARPDWKRADLRVVAFVQNPATREVLQAISSDSCGP